MKQGEQRFKLASLPFSPTSKAKCHNSSANYPYLDDPISAIKRITPNVFYSSSDTFPSGLTANASDIAIVFISSDSGENGYIVEGNNGESVQFPYSHQTIHIPQLPWKRFGWKQSLSLITSFPAPEFLLHLFSNIPPSTNPLTKTTAAPRLA